MLPEGREGWRGVEETSEDDREVDRSLGQASQHPIEVSHVVLQAAEPLGPVR
jgi:hypothetical protein